jgi:hypothetical protein
VLWVFVRFVNVFCLRFSVFWVEFQCYCGGGVYPSLSGGGVYPSISGGGAAIALKFHPKHGKTKIKNVNN